MAKVVSQEFTKRQGRNFKFISHYKWPIFFKNVKIILNNANLFFFSSLFTFPIQLTLS